MSATEELRKLFEERGLSCQTHYLHTSWCVGKKLYEAVDNLDGTLTVDNLTPEQAISATLGNGECELKPIPAIFVTMNMLNEIGWCKCSECGYATPDGSNYCQNCGRAVKQ